MTSWAPEVEANRGAGQSCRDLWEGPWCLLSGVRGTEPVHGWVCRPLRCWGPRFPTCNMASPQRLVRQLAGELNSQDVKAAASPPGGPSSLCPSEKTAVS